MLPCFLSLFIFFLVFQGSVSATKKSYIVYLGGHSHGPEVTTADLQRVVDSHHELLGLTLGSKEKAREAIFYSYKRHINGFAAVLEEHEAAKIADHPGVVSVFLNQARQLHTTHSWDFQGLEKKGLIPPSALWKQARFGEDTIIGNLDTGVWPESKSFSGRGFGPIPSRWKGICQIKNSSRSLCNRKLIGARYYNKGYKSSGEKLNSSFNNARDFDGHGSHTLSTAAGNFVPGANVFGIGNGTAKGGSPKARVAAYKVCWHTVNGTRCFDSDILKAFDTAIQDGVDVLSVSLGGDPSDYLYDGTAIGSFHAVMNGIVVVASGGNAGPVPGSISNVAPWLFTVGASTIDREFQAYAVLGNGKRLKGVSLSEALPAGRFFPLISAARAKAANSSADDAILCKPGTLDSKKVKGKILICKRGGSARVDKGEQALLAGAVGMILCNDVESGNEILADPHVLPATHISYTDGLAIFAYVYTHKNPKGLITAPKAKLGTKPAPFMASFSSRGPNTITAEILKPDITAPGVNIIAAYSEAVSPTGEKYDKRRIPFNSDSGTSMSCPHVAGIVGLIKTLHPKWSPAAIRSAIMTTARIRDNTGNPMLDSDNKKADPFAYGTGHIRPNGAMNPGLVYDLNVNDYLNFLCGNGYNKTIIEWLTGTSYTCPKNYSLLDFNYPSITVPNLHGSATVSRKLKNVGKPGKYAAHVRPPHGFSVSVKPKVLKFEKIGEEKEFKLTIKARKGKKGYKFGKLTWTDGFHHVRSPIVASAAGH